MPVNTGVAQFEGFSGRDDHDEETDSIFESVKDLGLYNDKRYVIPTFIYPTICLLNLLHQIPILPFWIVKLSFEIVLDGLLPLIDQCFSSLSFLFKLCALKLADFYKKSNVFLAEQIFFCI